jgi:hypothetical protein
MEDRGSKMKDGAEKGAAAQTGTRDAPFRSELQPLIDELYREEVLEARKMSPEEKFLAGEELSSMACEITLAGNGSENPKATEAECLEILEDRLRLGEWLQRNP